MTAVRRNENDRKMGVRKELGAMFEAARLKSRFARNLSAAARVLGISPSYLHKIEGADEDASPEVYAKICDLYGIPREVVFSKLNQLDPALEAKLVDPSCDLQELTRIAATLPNHMLAEAKNLLRKLAQTAPAAGPNGPQPLFPECRKESVNDHDKQGSLH